MHRRNLELVKLGLWTPDGTIVQAPTLQAFALDSFFPNRTTRNAKVERGLYLKHIDSRLGDMVLSDIRPKHVHRFVLELKATNLGASSVQNVHGVLVAILARARFEELISDNPARHLPRGTLPRTGKRQVAAFTVAEVRTLLTANIPEWMRVFVAMTSLGGMRPGEVAGRRWRDLKPRKDTLDALRVHTQYQDQPLKTARDEDTAERLVPVHPVLARVLHQWRTRGWESTYGRLPRPEDFIIADWREPNRPRAVTKNQITKAFKRKRKPLGITKGLHSGRRFFVTQARQGGAAKDIVARITHNPRGDILDLYTHTEWQPLCEAVLAIDFELSEARVFQLPKAANGDHCGDHQTQPRGIMVEALGIEPRSENDPERHLRAYSVF